MKLKNKFRGALPIFVSVVPLPLPDCLFVRIIQNLRTCWTLFKMKNLSAEQFGFAIGHSIATTLFSSAVCPTVERISAFAYYRRPDFFGKNGIGGRGWFHEDVDMYDGRMIKKAVIVYHDANKAGRHLDIHLGSISFVARITGKPIEKQLKFNHNGVLTESSKEKLMNFLRDELNNHS